MDRNVNSFRNCAIRVAKPSTRTFRVDRSKREFIQFPPILFLNNEIGLSLAALKDIIQLGISTNFLIAGLVVAYLIQDVNNKIESSKSRISDYGKEVVRVEQDA